MKFAQALRRIAGFTNHVNVRLVLEQTVQALPQQNMVVREQTADLLAEKNYFPEICAWGHTFLLNVWPEIQRNDADGRADPVPQWNMTA